MLGVCLGSKRCPNQSPGFFSNKKTPTTTRGSIHFALKNTIPCLLHNNTTQQTKVNLVYLVRMCAILFQSLVQHQSKHVCSKAKMMNDEDDDGNNQQNSKIKGIWRELRWDHRKIEMAKKQLNLTRQKASHLPRNQG